MPNKTKEPTLPEKYINELAYKIIPIIDGFSFETIEAVFQSVKNKIGMNNISEMKEVNSLDTPA